MEKIKKEVFELTKNNDSCIQNDNQYSFLCGFILNFLEGHNYHRDLQVKVRKERRAYITKLNRFKNIKVSLKKMITDNMRFIENLDQEKKNLFALFFTYKPENEKLNEEQQQLMIYGCVTNIGEIDK